MTTLSAGAQAIAPEIDRVRDFRKQAIENGYSLVRIRTCSKQPLGKQWRHGETEDRLLAVEKDELSTGLVTSGLRCVDVDVDDPGIVQRIVAAARRHLPQGELIRRRGNSCRLALIYRAADGQPGKRVTAGLHGKIEVLGDGQQLVVDGVHPSGASLYWKDGWGPDTVPRDQLPAATEEQIGAFLNDCAALVGASPQALAGGSPLLSTGVFEQPASHPPAMMCATVPVENELGAGIETPKRRADRCGPVGGEISLPRHGC
jgi:hypothetical protein